MPVPERIRAAEVVCWRTDRQPACQRANGFKAADRVMLARGRGLFPDSAATAQMGRKCSDWKSVAEEACPAGTKGVVLGVEVY